MSNAQSAVQAVNVVLNNKLGIDATSTIITATSIRNLISQRKEWENTAYKKSNDMLYAILQHCYAMEHGMRKVQFDEAHNKQAKKNRDALAVVAEELGYNFKSTTATMNRIVQCVFGNVARSRVSTYSKVLRSAKQHEISVMNLVEFIEQGNGVEQIRLKASKNYKTATQKAEIALPNATAQTIAVAKSDKLGQLIDAETIDEQCVLIATQLADGSFAINAVVHSKSALTAALVAFYGQQAEELKQITAKQQAANDSDIRADIAKNIVNK